MVQINALACPGVVGDGVHDDTAGLQAALDTRAAVVRLPRPPGCYLISRTLRMHSGQALIADCNACIRLANHAHAHMLTNADHGSRNGGISVEGGIWDGNNAHQTCEYHETGEWQVPYDPARYLGVLLQFNNVEGLRLAGLTLKDPETFGVQLANLRGFTVEDITFDYNLRRANMDGVHLHGNCHHGRIANLQGATNDDQVALNADDGSMYEMSRGPITDIEISGLRARNGYTGVRLLSAGSPVQRVRVRDLQGTYRYHVVSFTHHSVHPGEPSEFADIVLEDLQCAKPTEALDQPLPHDEAARHGFPLIWCEGGTLVRDLTVKNLIRDEALEEAPPTFAVSVGARVDRLAIHTANVTNRACNRLDFLHNEGVIERLELADVRLREEGGAPPGELVRNPGTIGELRTRGISR